MSSNYLFCFSTAIIKSIYGTESKGTSTHSNDAGRKSPEELTTMKGYEHNPDEGQKQVHMVPFTKDYLVL